MSALRGWACALVLALTGCMDHASHIETTPVSRSLRPTPEPASGERLYVVLEPLAKGLRVHARAYATWRMETIVTSRNDEVIDIRPSSGRWLGAAALFGAAAFTFVNRSKDSGSSSSQSVGLALFFAAGGTAVVVAPELAARRKRQTLGYDQQVLPAPLAPCADRALPMVRVTVRDALGTHEATTDALGSALLPDAELTTVRTTYVNDLAVPALGPPAGTR